MSIQRSAFVGLWLLVLSTSVLAAAPGANGLGLLPLPGLQPDPAIPVLDRVVGHAWGRDISSHAEMERYLKALVKAAPDRAALLPYGTSYEGRTLYVLLIAKPEILQRREEVRQANLQLADPHTTTPDQARALLATAPALVWLAFGIHGNETSSTEAAMLTAYHLLADRRPQTRQLLDRAVVLIDPLQNPDGHERFISAYREARGVFPDPQPLATEHTERWPSGRSNHYGFDMNRDWFLQSQRESQARAAAYLRWQPQIYADAHEMGHNATYFFSPKGDPVNPFFLPAQIDSLQRLGQTLGGRFDDYGFSYTTREMFDGFFPGYGSTWPTFQGGLGLLWEQAGVRGLVIRRDDARYLRFPEAISHHYVAALAAVEYAAGNAEQLVEEFYEARHRGILLGEEGPVRHYFLLPGSGSRAASLARVLKQNGVQVQRVTRTFQAECLDVRTSQRARREIPSGSFHIPVAQPAGRLARTLLDRHVDMGSEFVKRQLQRNEDRFPDEIYDVTAWSLPLAFGVDCLAAEAAVEVPGKPWEAAPVSGTVSGGRAKVAYLIADLNAARPALASWLRKGLRVHVADRELRIGETQFPRGTLILRVNENSPELHAVMQRSAKQHGLAIVASQTGWVTEGARLGGPHVRWIKPPRVAMLVDRPASYSVGHTWHLFDHVLGYPVTRFAGRDLGRLELRDFNVLVLPEGDYGTREAPAERDVSRLRSWVSEGGTLVLVKRAAAWATQKEVALLSSELKKKPAESPSGDAGPGKPAAGSGEAAVQPVEPSPGAFMRAGVFREHWLTFGCDDRIDLMYQGNVILTPPAPAKGRSLVTFAAEPDLLSSGFCWPETLDVLAGTPYLVHEPLGSGHVVAFVDDPNYRAMYPAAQQLFLNAVLFGPGY